MALSGLARPFAGRPLSGVERKTFARIEYFAFWTHLGSRVASPLLADLSWPNRATGPVRQGVYSTIRSAVNRWAKRAKQVPLA